MSAWVDNCSHALTCGRSTPRRETHVVPTFLDFPQEPLGVGFDVRLPFMGVQLATNRRLRMTMWTHTKDQLGAKS